jgi:hypothetical protein
MGSEMKECRRSAGSRGSARGDVAETERKQWRQGVQDFQPVDGTRDSDDHSASSNGGAQSVADRADVRIHRARVKIEAALQAVQLGTKKNGRKQQGQDTGSLGISGQSGSIFSDSDGLNGTPDAIVRHNDGLNCRCEAGRPPSKQFIRCANFGVPMRMPGGC